MIKKRPAESVLSILDRSGSGASQHEWQRRGKYNLQKDLEETKNLFEVPHKYRSMAITMNMTLFTGIKKIEERERRNQIGTNDL